jgi:ferric-dicitrate binding protein FerR (iron transport regulator)
MSPYRRARALIAALALLGALSPPAFAQDLAGCAPRALTNPARTVYECAGGLKIEAEAAARLGIAPRDAASETVEMDSGAALFDVTPGGRGLQIRTPHAIASVRGTVYALDVTPERTAVFVAEGRVRVTRRSGRSGVTLRAGQGVEVAPGRRFSPQRWPEPRKRALLSRLGR